MALIDASTADRASGYRAFQWTGATNGGSPDTFEPLKIETVPYAIVLQTSGTFAGSAAIALHGSLDGTNYVALPDFQGDAVSLTAAGMSAIGIPVLWIKPVMTSGNGSADIDVTVLVRYDLNR